MLIELVRVTLFIKTHLWWAGGKHTQQRSLSFQAVSKQLLLSSSWWIICISSSFITDMDSCFILLFINFWQPNFKTLKFDSFFKCKIQDRISSKYLNCIILMNIENTKDLMGKDTNWLENFILKIKRNEAKWSSDSSTKIKIKPRQNKNNSERNLKLILKLTTKISNTRHIKIALHYERTCLRRFFSKFEIFRIISLMWRPNGN